MEPAQKPKEQGVVAGLFELLRLLIGGAVMLVGILVTIFFAFSIVGYTLNRVGGGHPDTGFFGVSLIWLFFGAGPLFFGLMIASGGQQPSGRFAARFCLVALLLFIVLGADTAFGPNNWHAALRPEKLPGRDAASLSTTLISPHLQIPIANGTNALWCGTFQLAWDEVCQLNGGNLQFHPNHSWVTALNQHEFSKDCLDEGSFVAMAGTTASGIQERLRRAIAEKFHGEFKPRFLPDDRLTPRPQDIVAYACLFKHLDFPVPFERLDDGLKFGGTQVFAFGIGKTKASHSGMYEQVSIMEFRSPDDFVVELKTKAAGDRLVLAKVQPAKTLGDTIKVVRERMAAGKPEPTATNDVLIVPRISFDLTRRYSELEGRHLVLKATSVAPDLSLVSAVQNTKFEMNEKGVELRSESHMSIACAAESPPIRQHIMVFDKPFLLLMERAGAKMPYFALWVANPEILVRW